MEQRVLKAALTLVTLVLAAGMSFAVEANPTTKPAAKEATATSKPATKKTGLGKAAKVPQARLVDINTASKTTLKKLPGITDAHAGKIISGRPYLSKAHLLTRKILPAQVYASIKELVAVKDPAKALRDLRKAGKIR